MEITKLEKNVLKILWTPSILSDTRGRVVNALFHTWMFFMIMFPLIAVVVSDLISEQEADYRATNQTEPLSP